MEVKMGGPVAGAIYAKIPKLMGEIQAIGKDRLNEQQRYKFRGVDDVYLELHSKLAANGVFTTTEVLESAREERATKSGGLMTYSIMKIKFTFWADDGSSVHCVMIGEGSDTGDKSSNKAMSVAHKYAFLQVFAIPTDDDKDPENASPEFKAKAAAQQQRQSAPPAPKPATNTPPPPPGDTAEIPVISEPQRKRLYVIATSAGWTNEAVKEHLTKTLGLTSSKELNGRQYNVLIDFITKNSKKAPPPAPAQKCQRCGNIFEQCTCGT